MTQLVFGKELAFDERLHAYTWGGKPVPGVTTILKVINKPALIQWAANLASDHFLKELKSGRNDFDALHEEAKYAHRAKKEAAGGSGSNIHDYAECWFKGKDLPELKTDEAKRGAEAFHDWLKSHKIQILASERRVFSQEFYYAGTCDLVAKIDGVLGVGDFKTGKRIYDETRFQLAAYQNALQEEKKTKFDARWAIRFDKKTGKFEVKSFYDFDLDFTGFYAALNLHKTLQIIDKENKK
jgi:hypothetical protein